MPKKNQGVYFGFPFTFSSMKNVGLVRDSNPSTPASGLKIFGLTSRPSGSEKLQLLEMLIEICQFAGLKKATAIIGSFHTKSTDYKIKRKLIDWK